EGMMTAIRKGLEKAMGVTESRPVARGKLVDLLLIVGAALLTLVIVAITVVGNFVHRWSGVGGGMLAEVVTRTLTFTVTVLVVLLLYRFVPARGLRLRDGIVGAVVTALCLLLISFASGWIYDQTTQLSVIYGSLTAALVFLYSVYLSAAALLLGAEMAAGWARPPGPPGDPALVQLRKGVLGLFVTQKPSPDGADQRTTTSVSPSTHDTRTVSPTSAPSSQRASQSSPRS